MGMFSVLYLILLPVVWLPAAMLVVNKSAGDFVILATLSTRTKRKLSWSCLCCCSYQTVQKWGLYFWSTCGGRGKRIGTLLGTWSFWTLVSKLLLTSLGWLFLVSAGLCPECWLLSWLLQLAQLQHQPCLGDLPCSYSTCGKHFCSRKLCALKFHISVVLSSLL